MDEILKDFVTETAEHIEGVESQLVLFERDPADAALVAGIFRLVHTIKGTSSFLGLNRLQKVAHSAENLIGELRDGAPPSQENVTLILAAIDRIKALLEEIDRGGGEPEGDDADLTGPLDAQARAARRALDGELAEGAAIPDMAEAAGGPLAPAASAAPAPKPAKSAGPKAPETIRVAVDTIERIMQLVSELVLTRNQLLELTRNRENDAVKSPLQRLSGLTTDLQDAVMRARMQPVSRLFSNLPRLVRELSTELGKKLVLVTEGDDTELDRQLIEVLRDPLTHLIRNSADHGIETAEARLAAGKPETGEIRVSASHEAGQITITIADDGKGLDVERIRRKIVAQDLAAEADLARMSDEDVYRFIFEPGFSTAASVTNVSGRGVGMDVVRSNIELIGGTVSVASRPGRGCAISLKIPLTLAIAPALIIVAANRRFALPQHAVVEAVAVGSGTSVLEKVQNSLVVKLRDEVMPVADLREVLGLDRPECGGEERLAVIMRVGSGSFGVIVDAVTDIQEIVVKPLSASVSHLDIFSGHTILGDGSVVLILDPAGISSRLGLEKQSEKKRETAKDASATDKSRLLLFRAGPGALKILPVSLVGRIEVIDPSRVHLTDTGWVTLNQDRLIPVIAVHPAIDPHERAHPALILTAGTRTIGLLVDEIIDIVEDKLDMQLAATGGAVAGTAEIRGAPAEFIDISYYLSRAYPAGHVPQQGGRRLVLMDDDPFVLEMLGPVLVTAGYRVLTAKTPAAAHALAAQHGLFDAVIATVSRDLLQNPPVSLCNRQGGPLSPVIALSGEPVVSTAFRGGVQVVSKYDSSSLLGALQTVLAGEDGHSVDALREFAAEMAA